MGLYLQHKSEELQWSVWKMEEDLDTLFSLTPDASKASLKQKLQRFTSDHRKLEWLSVRVLLHAMLQEEKRIEYTPEGKPYLSDHSLFISISHTKGYVAVILSPVAPVGIDIEQYGQRVQRVVDRFIRPDELLASYLGDKTWSMLLHWSAKETIFKCMENADADLRKLCLSHFTPQEKGTFSVREYVTELQQLFTVDYRITPDFVLTWGLNRHTTPPSC